MSRLTAFFVRLFEYAIPDPYLFAALLTFVTAISAAVLAPEHSPAQILDGWYDGIFGILTFAFQMVLILVLGYAVAMSLPARHVLEWIAARPRTPVGAVTLVFVVSAIACWLNWGFGLVTAGLLARSVARRMRIDFGWLTAAAYSGFLVWASGLSSSIALAQATPGSALDIVQKLTGTLLPLQATVFARFTVVPTLLVVLVMAFILRSLAPREEDVVTGEVAALAGDERPASDRLRARPGTLAAALENAVAVNVLLAAGGIWALALRWTHGISLDIDAMIFILLILGLLLHPRPIAYARAVDEAARVSGPLVLQYPLYGGIMGIMTATGLAGVIAQWFDRIATAHTLPFWSYLASIVISLLVPSGGGHWAVQGPFAVPAAAHVGASQAATAMGVAFGEQVANMIQPFWCLPVLAITGVPIRRVMAFTVVGFVTAGIIYGLGLLVLVTP